MSYVAEALRGRSPTEIMLVGVCGYAFFIGVMLITARLMDFFKR